MTGFEFTFPNDPPIDPAYLRFVAGLQQALGELEERWCWRGDQEEWLVFSEGDWILEDVDLPDTAPGNAIAMKWDDKSKTMKWSTVDFYLPDLFRRLGAAYSKSGYPAAVWRPIPGGRWRVASERPQDQPAVPSPHGLALVPDADGVRRLRDVYEYEMRGFISRSQADRLSEAIASESS